MTGAVVDLPAGIGFVQLVEETGITAKTSHAVGNGAGPDGTALSGPAQNPCRPLHQE
jgi:hypothetical protein